MTLQATHKVGGSLLPPLSATISVTTHGVFAFILLFWLPRLCHMCHFTALPTKNMHQPRESRAPWQLNFPYHRNFPDPLLLIVNIWNSRKANVFHLPRKLHFKQQGAMFPRAMTSYHWKGKKQLKLASERQFRLAWFPLIGSVD